LTPPRRSIYKSGWHGNLFRAVPAALQKAAQRTTAIARMLGKAVKLRHCPATVSAPAQRPVLRVRAGNQPGSFRSRGTPCEPLHGEPSRARLWEGGWKCASQETGPRALNPLAFRGERRSHHACSYAIIF
jgi:hypothetical protein